MPKIVDINFFHIWNPSFLGKFSIFTFLDGGNREFIQNIVVGGGQEILEAGREGDDGHTFAMFWAYD
jgi:hypothetical protein